MQPCHTVPFLRPGVVADSRGDDVADARQEAPPLERCDYCGSARIEWRACKMICADCRQINKSCADL